MSFRRRKKPDPNAPPSPPRDNGLLPKPPEIDAAKAALLVRFPNVNAVAGFGMQQGAKKPDPCWRIYVFTNDPAVIAGLPAEAGGFPVERREVPQPAPWKTRR